MKPTLFLLAIFSLSLFINYNAQELPEGVKKTVINKKLIEFTSNSDLKTPLNAYLTITDILKNGKIGKLKAVSSKSFRDEMDENAPDAELKPEAKQRYIDATINEILVYKDSVACVISDMYKPLYSIRLLTLENGVWLNSGENAAKSLTEARDNFIERIDYFMNFLRYEFKLNKR